MKTFASKQHDQTTKYTAVRPCLACGRTVLHHQVVDYDRTTGFKTYGYTPHPHRCTRENRT
jgi:hypothetical protein